LHLIDICESSLNEARIRLRDYENVYTYKVGISINNEKFRHLVNKIDLLHCLLVFNHYLNYEQYLKTADFFNYICPKFMVLHNRNNEKLTESKNFTDYKEHYGKGLLMPTEYVLRPFTDSYTCLYHLLQTKEFYAWSGEEKLATYYEFFVLRKNK